VNEKYLFTRAVYPFLQAGRCRTFLNPARTLIEIHRIKTPPGLPMIRYVIGKSQGKKIEPLNTDRIHERINILSRSASGLAAVGRKKIVAILGRRFRELNFRPG
jgi:hypothetical protein